MTKLEPRSGGVFFALRKARSTVARGGHNPSRFSSKSPTMQREARATRSASDERAGLVSVIALLVGDEHAATLICRRSIQFAQRSRPRDYRRGSLGNQRPTRRSRQTDSRNPMYLERAVRWLRCHIWCSWRCAFRQHASFKSSPHPNGWVLPVFFMRTKAF
jgi:hypothetical protein